MTTEIFLSYARADEKKARRLANGIEAAGHSVWWDFQIEGGKRFAAVIDEALSGAEAVVVLWSSASVESAWVQDEAAAGRDSGRLVPVLLEQVLPPLGFRQYQCIDLSDWHGRGAPRQLPRLLSAIAAIKPAEAAERRAAPTRPASLSLPARRLSRKKFAGVSAAAFVIALAVAGFLWFRPGSASAAPSITVEPSSAAPPQSSTTLAHAVALDLGRFQAGPLSGMSITEAERGSASRSDYRLEIGDAANASEEHADVRLLDRGNQILWTTSIDIPVGRSTDLRQQVSAAVGAVLACAVRDSANSRLSDDVLRLYLSGCAGIFSSFNDQSNPELENIFRQITIRAPDFAGGWAGLALLQAWHIQDLDVEQMPSAIRSADETLQRARRINPHLDMDYAAESRLHPLDTGRWGYALAALDRGIADVPDSALLLNERTIVLQHLGRMGEAVQDAHSAVQLNPLSPSLRDGYISALAYAGHYEEAERELAAAERIWPNSTVLAQTRFRLELRYGDAAAADRLVKQQGDSFGLTDNPPMEAFIAARVSPTAENKAKAVTAFEEAFSREPDYVFGLVQALGAFGRVDEAFAGMQHSPTAYLIYGSDVLFRPDMKPILRDPRFMAVASRLGFIRTWRQTGDWPDFCSDPQLPYQCKAEAAKYPD